LNRLFRLCLLLGAAVFGGLLVYALTGNLAWKWGETAATIWFGFCVFLSGFLAHRLLPRPDLSDLVTEEQIVVEFDNDEISCIRPDGYTEQVRWDDLARVEVMTTNEGPWACDVYFVLHGTSSGCLIPQGATGDQKLVERLLELPGFDEKLFVDAMGCTSNRTFDVWKRSP